LYQFGEAQARASSGETIMEAALDHQKNPAEAWDIIASAKADKGEKIGQVKIYVKRYCHLGQKL